MATTDTTGETERADGAPPPAGVPPTPAPEENPAADPMAGLRRVTLIAIALAVLLFAYHVIAARTTPFSPDAQIQAFILRVAPEVTGQVMRIGVIDNDVVEEGEELFAIDPTPFELAVNQAQSKLAQADQTLQASIASVEAAQAQVAQARASERKVFDQVQRVLELVRRGVYPKAKEIEAESTLDEAKAATASAEANLRREQEALGPQGANNPQVQEALSMLEQARFNLSRTVITAPSRGVVTNLQLASGQTVVAGQPAMTFISAEDVWILAGIRENSIGILKPGQKAEVVLDVFPGQVHEATLASIGWGIAAGSVDQATGLPRTSSEEGWLGDTQRFPVHFVFDRERMPQGARYGSKASVIVYADDSWIMNSIAWLRIRLIALLTYIS